MYDRAKFFAGVRALAPTLTQSQVDGFNAVLDAAPYGLPREHLAYCLATAWHETDRTMRPIEEYRRGEGKKYGPTGFWGRGYVQLTWRENYEKASAKLGVDFVRNPDLVMRPDYAARIMFDGMAGGWFTGKKLSDYFGPGKSNPVGARRIINGSDKAEAIAGYHRAFLSALVPASEMAQQPHSPTSAPLPTQPQPKGFWARFWAALIKNLKRG